MVRYPNLVTDSTVQMDIAGLVGRVASATVKVYAGRSGNGSGVISGRRDHVLTNAHVALRSAMEVEFSDGTVKTGTVAGRDAARDLAIIRVPTAGFVPMELADSNTLRPGQIVLSVGNPHGSSQAVALGVVHAVQPPDIPWRLVVADIRLMPGFSGGPMVDSTGGLIGINTMVSGGLGLAVPSTAIKEFLAFHTRPKLGVALQSVKLVPPVSGQAQALLITEVSRGSPAAGAGITVGDIIASINRVPVRSSSDIVSALDRCASRPRLGIIRGESRIELQVALAANGGEEASEAA